MKTDIINRLHCNHLGIEKTYLKAKELVYRPGIFKEISDVIRNCSASLTFENINRKETITQRDTQQSVAVCCNRLVSSARFIVFTNC